MYYIYIYVDYFEGWTSGACFGESLWFFFLYFSNFCFCFFSGYAYILRDGLLAYVGESLFVA